MIQGKRIAGIILMLGIMVSNISPTFAIEEAEVPEAVYTGIDNATVMFNNIDYVDLRNTDTWAKEAIYETGALGLMKGFGARVFGLGQTLTKEQAIATAYRVAGREAEAQIKAEEIDKAKAKQDKKKNAISMWSDGYLQLAADEELITAQDLTDAFNTNQASLVPGTSFYRASPAKREEMAAWLAKALKLEPQYGQNKIFNSFNDWSFTDPIKIPYIEAVLIKNIMNGTGNGSFNPNGVVTRAQAAQIIKNSEATVLPILKLQKKIGTIEEVAKSIDFTDGESITTTTVRIRNSNGKLHKVDAQILTDVYDKNKSELLGTPLLGTEKDFIVYKNGKIGKSNLLEKGDRIEYIVGEDNTIRFTNVISSVEDTKYIAAQINSVDSSKLTLNVTQLLNLDYPNMTNKNEGSMIKNDLVNTVYRYSNNAKISIDGVPKTINDIKSETIYILTVKDNIVTDIKSSDMTLEGDDRIAKGVVEENNPQLGYITLYGENGEGIDPLKLNVLRTFNYNKQNSLTVLKNGKKAKLEDVESGDSVFLKLDEKLNVFSVSAVDNYIPKYARVISKKPSAISVEYDNGSQQVLPIDKTVNVIKNNIITSLNDLKDGDRVKLMMNVTNRNVEVKSITINDDQKLINNIYKGKLEYIDQSSDKLVVQNLEKLEKGQWTRSDLVGFAQILMDVNVKVFSEDRKIDIDDANDRLKSGEAYIAVEESYGGEEKAVLVSFRDTDNLESLMDDTIRVSDETNEQFGLDTYNRTIKYGEGTIIVKDNRLVSGSSISQEDAVYIVANRNNDNGDFAAGIVQISERVNADLCQIYRGRIKSITENKSFEVESFSKLNGVNWEYANTPKTFKINYDTQILDDGGLLSQRDFIGYGDNSFTGRSVYILADEVNAAIVSTAAFGPDGVFAKGKVLEFTGATTGETGNIIEQPTGIKLTSVKTYDTSKHIWVDSKDISVNILKNSIIVRNNKVITPSQIMKNDTLKIYKKATEDAGYIIICS